jgi:hypothetical protein
MRIQKEKQMSEYVTIAGLVQFDPRNRSAGGKEVRDVVIRAIGSNKNFSITIWPENANVPISKGDFLVADGKYTQSVGQNKDGEQTTWHNLSANTIIRIAGDATPQPAATPTAAAPATESDEFPF